MELVGLCICFSCLHCFSVVCFKYLSCSHLFFYHVCRVTEASGSGCGASWTAKPSRRPASTSSASAARRPESTSTLRSCSATSPSCRPRTASSSRSAVPCPARHADDCDADPRCPCPASAPSLLCAAELLQDSIRSNARSAPSAARNGTGTGSGRTARAFRVAGSSASLTAAGGNCLFLSNRFCLFFLY